MHPSLFPFVGEPPKILPTLSAGFGNDPQMAASQGRVREIRLVIKEITVLSNMADDFGWAGFVLKEKIQDVLYIQLAGFFIEFIHLNYPDAVPQRRTRCSRHWTLLPVVTGHATVTPMTLLHGAD